MYTYILLRKLLLFLNFVNDNGVGSSGGGGGNGGKDINTA